MIGTKKFNWNDEDNTESTRQQLNKFGLKYIF